MDVTVPQTLTADDDDRVADLAPRLLELLDAVVGEVDEVHHLVSLLADVDTPVGRVAAGDEFELRGAWPRAFLGFWQRLAPDAEQRRNEGPPRDPPPRP